MLLPFLLFLAIQPLQATPGTAEVRPATPASPTPSVIPVTKPDRGSERVCKRWAPIGSLVATHKECHSRAEWVAMAEQARATAQADASRRVTGGSLEGQ